MTLRTLTQGFLLRFEKKLGRRRAPASRLIDLQKTIGAGVAGGHTTIETTGDCRVCVGKKCVRYVGKMSKHYRGWIEN